MTKHVDFYSNYGHFTEQVLAAIRQETFGEDIGQNSWLSAGEFDGFISWLRLEPQQHILEVASGSGGPARYLAEHTQCYVTGIDVDERGIETATHSLAQSDLADRVTFKVADATARLPFDDNTFDGLMCIDAMNHLPNRLDVFREWQRVLRPGRRAVFTDPVLITGPVTNEELALRSSIGVFLFVPPGVNEHIIDRAGFKLVQQEDVSENCSSIARRWHDARQRYKEALLQIEGEERFEGLQKFFTAVHSLTSERRLSRMVYVTEKPA